MAKDNGKKSLGAVLVVLGVFFLLVNSGYLRFGWETAWPLFPVLAGISMMRLYTARQRPDDLFAALALSQLGLFFFVFTVGAVPWSAMATLWPFLILIPGIAGLAVAATGMHRVSALIAGLVAITVAVVAFWATQGGGGSSVFAPLVKYWPTALVVGGIMIYWRARRGSD